MDKHTIDLCVNEQLRLQPAVSLVISDKHDSRVDPSFSLDEEMFAFSNNATVQIWDVALWEPKSGPWRSGEGRLRFMAPGVLTSVFSPDSHLVVSGFYDGALWLFQKEGLGGKPDAAEAETKVETQLGEHDGPIVSVAFSPDGNYVVSGSTDETVRIWDVKAGTQVGEPLRGHSDWIRSVAFSPDGGRVVSGADDGTVRIWNAKAGTQVGEPLQGHSGWVTSVAFSPDGSRVVSGALDTTVRIWDAEAGKQVGELRGHSDYVTSVAFSPDHDGKYVVSGANDETVRIWDAGAGTQIGQPLKGHTEGVNFVAFSPNGVCVVAGSNDGTLRVWDIKEHIRRDNAPKPRHKNKARRKSWAGKEEKKEGRENL